MREVCLVWLGWALAGCLGYNISGRREDYDVENLVSEFGLQYCVIVEIGQGFCTLFAEFRDPDDTKLAPGTVAEVYLGECECSRLREWELCGPDLRDARGEACKFKEATGRDPSSARVHRRLCDFDHMLSSRNKPCDCLKRFDDKSLHPVKGFPTCFRSPLPKSICSRHSVCGVHACKAESIEGLALIQCDQKCKGQQPFCEEPYKPPMVTSYWSEWGPEETIAFSTAKVSEASCLSSDTRAPAFDCLGPGAYCCPQHIENCFCDVETTPGGRKVRRFRNFESHFFYPRSAKGRRKRSWVWDKFFGKPTEPPRPTEEPDDVAIVVDYRSGHNVCFRGNSSFLENLDLSREPTRDLHLNLSSSAQRSSNLSKPASP